MSVIPVWPFVASRGKVHLDNKAGFDAYVACAFGEGEVGELVARKVRRQRSYDQLKYW